MNEIVKVVPTTTPIFLYSGATNMSCSFKKLTQMVERKFKRDPQNGVYVFISRNRRRVKVLYWDQNGYAIWYKYLSDTVFTVAEVDGVTKITAVNLKALLGKTEAPKEVRKITQ